MLLVWVLTILSLTCCCPINTAGASIEKVLKDLKNPNEDVRIEAASKLQQISKDELEQIVQDLGQGLLDNALQVRYYCSEALMRCKNPSEVLPKLISTFNTEEDNASIRNNVENVLVGLGKASVPSLVSNLKYAENRSSRIRFQTIDVLGRIGKAAMLGVPELLKIAINDRYDAVRVHAALALSTIDPNDKKVIRVITPIFTRAIRNETDDEFRLRICVAFSQLPTAVKNADLVVPVLISLLEKYGLQRQSIEKDKEGVILYGANFCLGRFGTCARKAIPILHEILKDKKNARAGYLKMYVGGSLLRISPNDKAAIVACSSALPELVSTLSNDKIPEMSVYAAEILGQLGPIAKKTLPDLERAAKSPNEQLRSTARMALRRIRGKK